MRYRFSGFTKDGEARAGFLEAEDEAGARRQVERRGLTVESLQVDRSDTPTHVKTDDGAITKKMPLPQIAKPKWEWPEWDYRRLGLVGLVALLVLGAIAWGVSRAMSDKTYHLKLTGQFHVQTRRKLAPDYWKGVIPLVSLPKPRWFINSQGVVYARGADGKWKPLDRRAKVTYQATAEGGYTIEIEVALPNPPESCALSFYRRGFRRSGRRGTFQLMNDVYQSQISTITLLPRQRRTRSGSPTSRTRRPVTTPATPTP